MSALHSQISDIVEFTRIYLAVFYSFVAIFYTSKILLAKKAQEQELVFPGASFSATWFNHMAFRVFRVAIWWVCLVRVFFPSIDNYLGVFTGAYCSYSLLLGNALLALGFGFTLIVHFSLGQQWRSGIDPKGPAQLLTGGFYRYSRNPMFLGVATAQLGFFLALPSLFSLVCLVVGLWMLHRQTLAEEQHLQVIFPKEYTFYRQQVGRWL